MYTTLEDVFEHGLENDITWIKVHRVFDFNKHTFNVGHILYIPRRAFERKKGSLTVYSFPDGNLHILPLYVEGDFEKCEKKTDKDTIEQSSRMFTAMEDRNNNMNNVLLNPKEADSKDTATVQEDIITDFIPADEEEDEEDSCSRTTSSGSTVSFPSSGSSSDDEPVELTPLQMIWKPDERFDGKSNDIQTKSKTLSPTGKYFQPFFNQNVNNTIGSHYHREKDGGKKSFDKRFSLFSDKAYVTMTSIDCFEELCKSHDKKNSNLTQEDYLDMEHPVVNLKLLFPSEDAFEVELRKRSKSDVSKKRKRFCATKSIGDFSKLLVENGSCENEKLKLRSSTIDCAVSSSADKSERKSTSLYDRLMSELQVLLLNNEDIQDYDEDRLCRKLGFNRFESRIIYHSIRGWRPTISATSSNFPANKDNDKVFPEDFTVHELYLFIKSLDNPTLAEYLRKYNIDGLMMEFLVRDDLFLDTMLFDDSFVKIEQLVNIRKKYFPRRPRLNAVGGRGVGSEIRV